MKELKFKTYLLFMPRIYGSIRQHLLKLARMAVIHSQELRRKSDGLECAA